MPLGSFADIPAEIRRRVMLGERVLLILLDAFGLEFLERHREHPLVRSLDVTPLRTQFPSTTTANITTLHYGVPVEQHGLYEWNILEPSLGELICPLRYARVGSSVEGDLVGELDPLSFGPGPTFYETLGVPSQVYMPSELSGSVYTRMACGGATVTAFEGLREGCLAALASLAEADAGHALLYWEEIDTAGHVSGPGSAQFASASLAALDAVWAAVRDGASGVTVLISADHGQVDVSPERVDYLDELWPELPGLLAQARPAGSARDVFLHVRHGCERLVLDGLSERLGDRAKVRAARDLFGVIGPRLASRLGDVAVLPVAGRQAWMLSATGPERIFRGHHGGLEPAETATYLARLL